MASRSRRSGHADDARSSRTQEQRGARQSREQDDQTFLRPTSLEAPPPRPGYRQKWVRFSLNGKDDTTNWARKQRQGWQPRKVDTVPKDFHLPKLDTGRFAGCIVVEGMILCELPEELARRRGKIIGDRTQAMTDAISQNIRSANQAAGHGFGTIKKAERSVRVKEVRAAPSETESSGGEDADLNAE